MFLCCPQTNDTYNMKELSIDVMVGERFYCTLRYSYNPLFPISIKELEQYIATKCPTLKKGKYKIVIY